VVAGPIGVDERSAVAQRRLRVEDRLERLVFDPDPPAGLGCELGRERRDGGDDLALETDDVAGEERPVANERAVPAVRHIVLGQHREHTGQRTGGRDVDGHEPGVRNAGEQQLAVDETWTGEVGEVASAAGRLLEGVGSRDAGAYDPGQGPTLQRGRAPFAP
jgi:hypothetical protein